MKHWRIDGTHIVHTELKHGLDFTPEYKVLIPSGTEEYMTAEYDDWIRQLEEKTWMTKACLEDFQDCFEDAVAEK